MEKEIPNIEVKTCAHCGEPCREESTYHKNNSFCCLGCQTVFEILAQSDMDEYYRLQAKPGISMKRKKENRYGYLDQDEIIEQLVDYKDDKLAKIQFYLPQIHCSACIWLLENLYKLNPNVLSSRVNFLRKEAYITFDIQKLSLKTLVELLSSLGYEPDLKLNQLGKEQKKTLSKKLIYQVGLAGFAFGNIMLMSLPEYFGLDLDSLEEFRPWFSYLNLILASPVAIYSGQDYFRSAYHSLKRKRLNIDVPIALGIFVLYSKSAFEIINKTGIGYLDSLCGLLFFLLLGRIFQEKIYHQLSFERDYRSYFPISISKLIGENTEEVPIQNLHKGDKILIRNGELIPVDAFLIKGKANIDNSFATGESKPISKSIGDKIHAGGRQVGEAIQLEVIKPLEQSKLTRLWSEYASKEKSESTFSKSTDKISQAFTPIILIIAFAAALFHFESGIGKSVEIIAAVLIVACPCALALSAPFTFGHAMRWLGSQQFYLREASVLENMSEVNHLVFDKTGTITINKNATVNCLGKELDVKDKRIIYSICQQSTHPLSRMICEKIGKQQKVNIQNFEEIEGKGLSGKYENILYKIGSAKWIGSVINEQQTESIIEKDARVIGKFCFQVNYRAGLEPLLKDLSKNYAISLLTGDNNQEEENLKNLFPKASNLLFSQSPKEKLEFIKNLQDKGAKCMMIGDGLNDAGALREASVGLAIAEDVNAFSPASDIIVAAEQFQSINQYLNFAKRTKTIVYLSFAISFLYNIIGLSFAVRGELSPVFAAILMPLSSITVVLFASISVWLLTKLK